MPLLSKISKMFNHTKEFTHSLGKITLTFSETEKIKEVMKTVMMAMILTKWEEMMVSNRNQRIVKMEKLVPKILIK